MGLRFKRGSLCRRLIEMADVFPPQLILIGSLGCFKMAPPRVQWFIAPRLPFAPGKSPEVLGRPRSLRIRRPRIIASEIFPGFRDHERAVSLGRNRPFWDCATCPCLRLALGIDECRRLRSTLSAITEINQHSLQIAERRDRSNGAGFKELAHGGRSERTQQNLGGVFHLDQACPHIAAGWLMLLNCLIQLYRGAHRRSCSASHAGGSGSINSAINSKSRRELPGGNLISATGLVPGRGGAASALGCLFPPPCGDLALAISAFPAPSANSLFYHLKFPVSGRLVVSVTH